MASVPDRRGFLAHAVALAAPLPRAADPWDEAAAIVSRIKPPAIRRTRFPITAYGAVGNGTADCTRAIKLAVGAARQAGGGRVVVPAGTFLTGAVELYGQVGLHLEQGAVLRFKTDPAAYLPVVPTRFNGIDCYNYRPLIRLLNATNVAITGPGTVDGAADNTHWWPWRGKEEFGWSPGQPEQSVSIARLRAQAAEGVVLQEQVYGEGGCLRLSLIQAYHTRNVLIDGVTLTNAPWWMIHGLFSSNVTIRNVTSASLGPNNDGCDLESCDHVLVERCVFRQRDDKVVVKSGFGRDGVVGAPGARRPPRPSTDIVVRDCRMTEYGAALAIGSEIGAGAARIFAENLRNLAGDGALNHLCLIKSSTWRGGTVRGVRLRNCAVAACDMEAVMLTYTY
jgi:polygalacturonase